MSRSFSSVIFDFDGTLFDSRKGIISSVKYALDDMGIPYPSEDELTAFIGPPLLWSFKKQFALDEEEAKYAVSKLREHYDAIGYLGSQAYAGMESLICALKAKSCKLAIATAKPTIYAEKILVENNWQTYFDSLRGSSLKGELYPKERTIGEALEDLKVMNKEKVVMIGDTIYDIKGA
ncbi:MAG: HAD hydrolase-like protein, partial [Bacteroidetes bacterium]|nr:HAD hydrolase-like protein [Bacteroidota bacterium]